MSFLDSEDLRIINQGCQTGKCASSPSKCYSLPSHSLPYDSSSSGCNPKSYSSNSSCARPLPNCQSRDNYMFMSTMSPVNNLIGSYTQCENAAQFLLRRKNKVVTLQWEPFSGTINVNGAPYIEVQQTIHNLPPYPLQFPIFCTYLDSFRTVLLEIIPAPCPPLNPCNYSCYKGGNIRFYLFADKSGTNVHMNDTFSFPASAVSWIVES